MNKYFEGDVYIIDGIDSTAQLIDFYNEVVEKNIEKYYGITVQGRRFEYDENKKKAVVLGEDKFFGINPNYRKIEPVEEVVSDQEQEPVANNQYDNIEVTVNAEQATVVNEQPAVAEVETQLHIELEQLKEALRLSEEEKAVALERAAVAEGEWEKISTKNKELRAELEAKNAIIETPDTAPSAESRLNELLDELKLLGFEVYLKRI